MYSLGDDFADRTMLQDVNTVFDYTCAYSKSSGYIRLNFGLILLGLKGCLRYFFCFFSRFCFNNPQFLGKEPYHVHYLLHVGFQNRSR